MDAIDPIDSAIESAARNWINTVNRANQWRLQILSRRYRKDPSTGKRKMVPMRMRRFVEGCPANGLKAVIDILLDMAPYEGILYNGQKVPGKFRPTLTAWRRDDQMVVNGISKTDGTYTLVQDLVEDTLKGDRLEGPATGSCSEKVETMYVWDAPAIDTLPEPTQGVTYGIQSVNRSEEGEISYVVVKRTALTQFGAEVKTSDTSFDTSYSRTYKNLYGDPNTGFRSDDGSAVMVPGPDDASAGTVYEVQTQQNDDCTWNAVVQRKVSKAATSEESSSRTIFESTDGTVKRGQAAKLAAAPGATGGKIVSRKSELRPDGNFDNTEQVRQEKRVASASVEKAVTLKGVRVTTVNRNMPAAASYPTAIGSTVKNERTDGGLYNQTITTTDPTPIGRTGEECVETAVEHRHTTLVNQTTNPGSGHVTYGVGFTKERSISLTDVNTFDVRETTRTARALAYDYSHGTVLRTVSHSFYRNAAAVTIPAPAVNVEVQASLTKNEFQCIDGTVSRTVHVPKTFGPVTTGNVDTTQVLTFARNQTAVTSAVGAVNKVVDLSASLNDHGSYDWTKRETTYSSYGPATIATATSTLKTSTIQFAKNNVTPPSLTGGVNIEYSVSATRNDHGSFDWTLHQTEYKPYGPRTIATATGTLKNTTITAAYNQLSVATQSAGANEEISISASMNSHGSFDWTAHKDRYRPYGPKTIATATGMFKTTTITAAYNQTSETTQTAGTNEEISISASMNSHGSFDWTARKDRYSPYGPQLVATTDTPVLTTQYYVGLNNQSVTTHAGSSQSCTLSVSMNSRGTFDTHEVVRTPKPMQVGPVSWTAGTGTKQRTYQMIAYRNQNAPITLNGTYSASASASINEFGLCDGSAVAADGGTGDNRTATFSGVGGTVAYYVMFQTPGGKRYRQRITADCERMVDTPYAVAHFLAGGESIGPFVSRSEGGCGHDWDGTPFIMGVKYTNVNFDSPEEIS